MIKEKEKARNMKKEKKTAKKIARMNANNTKKTIKFPQIKEGFREFFGNETIVAPNWKIIKPDASLQSYQARLIMWTDDGKKLDDVILRYWYLNHKTNRLYCFTRAGKKYHLCGYTHYRNPNFSSQSWEERIEIIKTHLENITNVT